MIDSKILPNGILLSVLLFIASQSTVANPLYFTSNVSSEFGISIVRGLTQRLLNGSYRTAKGIHVAEIRHRNGAYQISLWVDRRERFRHGYATYSVRTGLSSQEVVDGMLRVLEQAGKAVVSK